MTRELSESVRDTLTNLGRAAPGNVPADVLKAIAGSPGLRRPVSALPPDVVAKPAVADAWDWHRDRLLETLGACDDDQRRSQRAYHANWLLALQDVPANTAALTLSVIIPVYNRAAMVVEAIDSALAQVHAAVEIVVIDDGSTDDLRPALAPYEGRIVLLRQENRGVAHARNRGIRAATGDYLCFLDSDNLLDADVASHWLRAFAAVPDAALCYAPPRQRVHAMGRGGNWPLPDGGENCPTTNLLRASSISYPFPMVGACLPRWVALRAGGFDESLEKGEDARFWFRLGLDGAKVVGLARRLNERRVVPGSLSDDPEYATGSEAYIFGLGILDLLERPRHWNLVENLLRQMSYTRRWHWLAGSDHADARRMRSALSERIREIARHPPADGASTAALLDTFARALDEMRVRHAVLFDDAGAFLHTLSSTVAGARKLVSAATRPAAGDRDSRTTPGGGRWRRPTIPRWLEALALDGELPPDFPSCELPTAAAPPQPEGLVARPGPACPVRWHHRKLQQWLRVGAASPARRAAAQFHGRAAARLLAPGDERFPPVVSVVIPVHDRAREVVEAVNSALGQTLVPAEVIVVDDGSTQDIGEALSTCSGSIRLLRQPNRGPGAARNLGIGAARGEFVHLLDSDDLLDAHAIAAKVAAFGAIADAELAFSAVRNAADADGRLPKRYEDFEQPATGLPGCPTRDLMAVVAVGRYPFLTSTVLAPRWLFLALGGFNPVLRRAQDSHLFFRLGLRGTKVVGLKRRLTTRRVLPRRQSLVDPGGDVYSGLVTLLDLLAVLECSGHWTHLPSTLRRVSQPHRWPWIESGTDPRLERLRCGVLQSLSRLDDDAARACLVEVEKWPASAQGRGRFRYRAAHALKRAGGSRAGRPD